MRALIMSQDVVYDVALPFSGGRRCRWIVTSGWAWRDSAVRNKKIVGVELVKPNAARGCRTPLGFEVIGGRDEADAILRL